MTTNFLLVVIGSWLLLVILAIINAVLRNQIYRPYFGDLRAHQFSTLLFIIMILLVTYLVLRFSGLQVTDQEALIMGALWLVFTIIFEFLAGHYVFGNSWKTLIADYNILKGRVWSLVLLTTMLSPYAINTLFII
jgi:hypothetical protein